MNNNQKLWLFIIPSFIWGSTWYAITFQLGKVDPIVSVAYRSGLAGILLLIYCYITKQNLKYSLHQHFFLFLQGLFLYGVNYWFVYVSESTITSGLVAIIFSLIVILNIVFGNIFLKIPINRNVVLGAVLGLIGTAVIFYPEIVAIEMSTHYFQAIAICLIAVVLASLGNIIASHNHNQKIPVIQSNAFGMTYGAIILAIIAIAIGKKFDFDFSISYIGSLLYLTVLGSIVAFNTYLKLMSFWGPGKAAYIILVTPVIAIIISYFLEDYKLSIYSLLGVGLVLCGNYLVVIKKKVNA